MTQSGAVPARGDKTFDEQQVLARAMELFWRKGYDGAGMAELLQVMGIGRQSLYDTFGDKRGLFLAALHYYAEKFQQPLLDVLLGPGDPLARVRGMIAQWEGVASYDDDCRGCLLANTATEFGLHDEQVQAFVQLRHKKLEDALRRVLEEARQAGELSDSPSPRALARSLTTMARGLMVLARTRPSRAEVQDVVRVALALVG